MKKSLLALLVAALLSVGVALSLGASPAFAANCPGGGASYVNVQAPAIGQTISVGINATAASYQNGDFRSFVQVFGLGGSSITAGLISDGHGLQSYMEHGGTFYHKVDANKFHVYTMTISRINSNTYLVADGNGGNQSFTMDPANLESTLFESKDNQSSGTCNGYAFSYSNESPFNLKCAGSCSWGSSPTSWPVPQNITTSSFNTISGP